MCSKVPISGNSFQCYPLGNGPIAMQYQWVRRGAPRGRSIAGMGYSPQHLMPWVPARQSTSRLDARRGRWLASVLHGMQAGHQADEVGGWILQFNFNRDMEMKMNVVTPTRGSLFNKVIIFTDYCPMGLLKIVYAKSIQPLVFVMDLA